MSTQKTKEIKALLEAHDSLRLNESPEDLPTPESHLINKFDQRFWDILYSDKKESLRQGQEAEDHQIFLDLDSEFMGDMERALYQEQIDFDGLFFDEEVAKKLGEKFGRWEFDRCAWYQPMHYFGNWGIFIREDCMLRQAVEIAQCIDIRKLGVGTRDAILLCIKASFLIYYLHEHYHHKVESFGIRTLITANKPAYLDYKAKVYRSLIGDTRQLEEAMANADAYHRLGDQPYKTILGTYLLERLRLFLIWTFKYASPPGYDQAVHLLRGRRSGIYKKCQNKLMSRIWDASLTPSKPEDDWNLAPNMIRSWFNLTDNIYTIVSVGKKSIFPSGTP